MTRVASSVCHESSPVSIRCFGLSWPVVFGSSSFLFYIYKQQQRRPTRLQTKDTPEIPYIYPHKSQSSVVNKPSTFQSAVSHKRSFQIRMMIFYQTFNATKIVFIGSIAVFFFMGTLPYVSASIGHSPTNSVTSPISPVFQKHPLEDSTSWKLHRERLSSIELHDPPGLARRSLQTTALTVHGATPEIKVIHEKNELEDEQWELPFEITHKKQKKHVPFAGGDTTHGIMIDAGSVSVLRPFVPRDMILRRCYSLFRYPWTTKKSH